MAKQRDDDQDPKNRPPEEQPHNALPLEEGEVQEVMDIEDLEDRDDAGVATPVEETPDAAKDKKTHLAGKAPQPTMLAPQDELTASQEKSETPPEKPKDFVEMPNLSIDDDAEILAEEAGKPAAGSSVVEIVEMVEDVGDVHVLGTDAFQTPGGSSVVEIAELLPEGGSAVLAGEVVPSGSSVVSASVIHIESDVVPSGVVEVVSGVVEAAPVSDVVLPADAATPPPAADDIFAADMAGAPEEPASGSSNIFTDAPEEKEELIEPMPDKEEAVEEITQGADSSVKDTPALAEDVDDVDVIEAGALADEDESSAVDLGKPPSDVIDVDAAEAPSSKKQKKAGRTLDDEVSFEDDEETPKKKSKVKADEDQSLLEDSVLDEDEAASALLSGAAAGTASDIAAQSLLDDDEMPAKKSPDEEEEAGLDDGKPVAKGEKKKLKAEEEDEEAAVAAAEDEDEPVAKKKKGKKKKGGEDEDEELVGVGAGKRGQGVAKPKYGRHWAGGMLVGVLLAGVALAGIWFAKPELIEQAYKSTSNYKEPPKAKIDPPAVKARAEMDNNNFARAVDILDAAIAKDKSPVNLSARAEARWRNYLDTQQKAKKPLDRKSPEVAKVLEDLNEADNRYLLAQVTMALDDNELRAGSEAKDIKLKELKVAAEKAEVARKEAEKNLAAVADVLIKEKLLDDKDKLDPAVFQKIVKDLGESKTTVAAVNKLLDEAKIKEAGDKGVAKILTAKKDVEEKLDAVNKLLADAKVKDEGAKGLEELLVMRDKLSKDRDELDQALKGAYKELSASGMVPPSDDPRGQIVAAVKIARQKAESPVAVSLAQLANSLAGLGTGVGKMIEKSYDSAAMTAELAFYRLREPFILSPEQNMDSYIALLRNMNLRDAGELTLASREAGWVLSAEAKAPPEARGKAFLVAGLADRNMGKLAPARKNLKAALEVGAKFKDAPWMQIASTALEELSDPAVYFLPTAEKLASSGKYKEAQDVLTMGLKVMPDNPRLVAYRGLIRLEAMRGHKDQLEAAQKEIRQDIGAAFKNAAAPEAAYLLGTLEEELGNLDKAEDEYRKAIKASQGKGEDGSRYIIALARLLQRDRAGSVALPPEPNPAEPKKEDAEPKKKDDADKKKDQARLQSLRGWLALALVGAQLPGDAEEEDPAAAARIRESIELAKQLIQSADPKIKGQGHMILGRALSKQGKHTEGLREYARGLELLQPGVQTREMSKLLEEHPAFQQPDATHANPMLAEQFYGKGLHQFWSGNYREAETMFKQAVQYYNLDARYQYYLGLSLLRQKGNVKRDAAYFALEQGARLEAGNRPSMAEVNASLERLQGPMRAYLDSYRQKALSAGN